MVEGRPRSDSWDDKQTGQKRSRLVVVLEQFQLLDSAGGRGGGEGEGGGQPREQGGQVKTRAAAPVSEGGSEEPAGEPPGEDDVPF